MSGADRLERKALETLHAFAAADVQFASPEHGWDAIAASRFRSSRLQMELPPLRVPVFGVNYGPSNQLERTGRRSATGFGPGQLAIAPAEAATHWGCERVCDVVVVCLSRDVLDRAVADCSDRDPRSIEIVPRFAIRDLVLERIAHQLLREIVRPEPGTRVRVQSRANELALHLLRAHSNLGRPFNRQARTIPPHKLNRVRDFIYANLARDLSLAEVAGVAEMTVFHFAKAFRQATGSAPHRYLIERRILRGRTLLHDPTLSIRAIAAAVGFTHSHFTRLFTRHMGMTPSAFRALLQA